MRSLIYALVGGALLLGGGLWWRASHAPAAPAYLTAAIDRGTVARTVTASGTVNPVLTVVVGSYVSGVIRDIACDYNTRVRKGQVCATIDPRPYELALEQARAEVANAQAQLTKDQANLAYLKLAAERQATLLAQDSTSRDAADVAAAQRDQARAQVQLDRTTIQQRLAALEAARVNLGYTRISSPVDGVVVSRNVTMGQTVAASFQTPTLFLIAQDLTQMQVDTSVSESDIESQGRGVREGDAAVFTVEALPGHPFTGKVAQIRQAPQTIQNVVTYDVVIAVANPGLKLKPGMTATVRIVTDQRKDVLRAPNPALRFTPGGLSRAGSGRLDRVWMLKDGQPTPVRVTPGLEDDSFTEIAGGRLRPGDRVITGQKTATKAAGSSVTPRMPRL